MRRPGWRGRLDAVVNSLMGSPHVWGENDCAAGLGARCIEAITGEDLAAPFRGAYSSPDGAREALLAAGYADLKAFAAEKLGEPVHPSLGRSGDVVLMPCDGPFGWAVGVFLGERVGVLRPDGYGTIDRGNLAPGSFAFRVG